MVNKNGSLAKKFPDLLKEWNYEKNRDINPYKITSNTHKKAWWKCKNGHEWYANISNRTRKHCGGNVKSVGLNGSKQYKG